MYFHIGKDNSVQNIGEIAAGCYAVGQNIFISVYNILVRLRYEMIEQGSKSAIIIFMKIHGIMNQ